MPIILSASSKQLLIGTSAKLKALQGTTQINGAWSILGGTQFGTIEADGTLHAPATLPTPNAVLVQFSRSGAQTAQISLNLVNPTPTITSASVATITPSTNSVVLAGSGFLATSTATINGSATALKYIDAAHVSVNVMPATKTGLEEKITVANPFQDSSVVASIALVTDALEITASPSSLAGGDYSLTLKGAKLAATDVVFVDGKKATSTYSQGSIRVTGFLAPWKTGSVLVQVKTSVTANSYADLSLPISQTPVTFEAASRFSMQAGFGPRPDLVSHIQAVGFTAFLDEQMVAPALAYTTDFPQRTYWLRQAGAGNSVLRMRVASALESFITTEGFYIHMPYTWWEVNMQNDAFANVRTLFTHVTSDASMAEFLNIAGNAAPSNPSQHANQNFARELMQLFSLGPDLLNDDGSIVVDATGQRTPAYDEATLLAMSRVFTGWNLGKATNPTYTFEGRDLSAPLVLNESQHDHGAKTIFGNVILPAGQTGTQDRDAALDAIFQHQNLPPFFCKRLIQRLVTSNPSPQYLQRTVRVFKNDGHGVRGNLAAVVRAILLDPEARRGDNAAGGDTDGFLQDPVLFQTFVESVLQNTGTDGEIEYWPGLLGSDLWVVPNVFGSLDPNYPLAGTDLLSPESKLHTNQELIHRSDILYGMVMGKSNGFTSVNWNSWLYSKFSTLPDFVDALDHLLYQGRMPQAERDEIMSACSSTATTNLHLAQQTALFLALNADSYTVVH